jgi:hypothetical protein
LENETDIFSAPVADIGVTDENVVEEEEAEGVINGCEGQSIKH